MQPRQIRDTLMPVRPRLMVSTMDSSREMIVSAAPAPGPVGDVSVGRQRQTKVSTEHGWQFAVRDRGGFTPAGALDDEFAVPKQIACFGCRPLSGQRARERRIGVSGDVLV